MKTGNTTKLKKLKVISFVLIFVLSCDKIQNIKENNDLKSVKDVYVEESNFSFSNFSHKNLNDAIFTKIIITKINVNKFEKNQIRFKNIEGSYYIRKDNSNYLRVIIDNKNCDFIFKKDLKVEIYGILEDKTLLFKKSKNNNFVDYFYIKKGFNNKICFYYYRFLNPSSAKSSN